MKVLVKQDHVASCPEERERVTKAGGLVKWQVDTWRVGAAALQVWLFYINYLWYQDNHVCLECFLEAGGGKCFSSITVCKLVMKLASCKAQGKSAMVDPLW